MIPQDLKYTKDHEWVKVNGTQAIVGITDYAQSQLGDITFVELPEMGKGVNQADTFSTVESVKAASDVYAPVSGKVVAVNDELEGAPEVINSSPYDAGWICKLDITNESELAGLMDSGAYEQFVKESE